MKIRTLTVTEKLVIRKALQALNPSTILSASTERWGAGVMLEKRDGNDFVDKLLWIEELNDYNSQG